MKCACPTFRVTVIVIALAWVAPATAGDLAKGPDVDVAGVKLGMLPAQVRGVLEKRGGVNIAGHAFPLKVLDGSSNDLVSSAVSGPPAPPTLQATTRGRLTHQTPGGKPCDESDPNVFCVSWEDYKRDKEKYGAGSAAEAVSVAFVGDADSGRAYHVDWRREFYYRPPVETAKQELLSRYGRPSAEFGAMLIWMWDPAGKRLAAEAKERGHEIWILDAEGRKRHPCGRGNPETMSRADPACGRTLQVTWKEEDGATTRLQARYFDHLGAAASWAARQ